MTTVAAFNRWFNALYIDRNIFTWTESAVPLVHFVMTTPLTAAVAIVPLDSNVPTGVTPITFLYDQNNPTVLTLRGSPPVTVPTNKWEPAQPPHYSWNNVESSLYMRMNQGGLPSVISVLTGGLPPDATPQTPRAISATAPTTTQTTTSTPTPTTAVESSPLATTATSPPVATITSSPANNGLAVGAIAGIAAGSFVAGALIAALLTWFMAKKKKPAKATDSEASTVLLVNREKANDAKTISISSSSPMLYASEGVATQPLEDKAISGEVSKISNLIKNHVQSYYHGKNVSAGMIDYDDLHALGPGLPVSVGTLGTLLANSKTREIALRFCIAWVVTSRTQLHESSHRSFLPLEVSECLQVMSPESWDSKGMLAAFTRPTRQQLIVFYCSAFLSAYQVARNNRRTDASSIRAQCLLPGR